MLHIGIIPDGNRRWAKKNKVDDIKKSWAEKLFTVLKDFKKKDYNYINKITEITLYVASSENLKRNDKTSQIIFDFIEFISKNDEMLTYLKKYVNIIPIGDMESVPEKVINILKNFKSNNKLKIYLGIGYDYKKDLLNFGLKNNENYNRDQTEIDLIIRSGKELRLSGFFPCHNNYAELFFLEKMWPEVNLEDIDNVLKEFFETRERRFGR